MMKIVPASMPVGRRGFLLGAAATGLLAACGSSSPSGSPTTPAVADGADELTVARFFGSNYLPDRVARVPIGLADADGLLPADRSPASVTISVAAPDGSVLVSGLEAPLYSEGLPRAYYAFEFTPTEPGFFDVTVDTGSASLITQVGVAPADDPIVSAVVGPGDPMPPVVTPTIEDPAGVDPICTRSPMCDLHDHSVAELVSDGVPFLLLVSTPAFCQTAICGPVLDVLLDVLATRDVRAVHAEVYRDPANNPVPPAAEDYAPVIGELGLLFEPVLYAVGADGIVTDRIEYLFGGEEVAAFVDRHVT